MSDYIMLWVLFFIVMILACIALVATGIADALYRWWLGEGAFLTERENNEGWEELEKAIKEVGDGLPIQETDRNNE